MYDTKPEPGEQEDVEPRSDVKAVFESIQSLDNEGRNQLCAMLRENAEHDESAAEAVREMPDEEEPSEDVDYDKFVRGPGLTIVLP